MMNRRDASPSAPILAGASSLIRLGLGAAPRRLAPISRVVVERPFLLRQRFATRQLDLFGPLHAAR
jgi:hypothetical protein